MKVAFWSISGLRVDAPLLALIAGNNGIVVSQVEQFDSIRAWVPLESLRTLAASQSVKFIAPAAEAELNRVTTNPKTREALRKQLRTYMATSPGAEPNTGAVNSQGDVTHRADLARAGLVFSGIKIGILSDSIDDAAGSYAAAIASGDVPVVTVLPGQSGGAATAEGLAMLEIVYDLCPGAQLYFATAFGGPASFAQNILDLRAAGCDVIVDDVGYFNESPFFDDVISQAVTSVTASGALYFSSCGNAGTKKKNSAGRGWAIFWTADLSPRRLPVRLRAACIHLPTLSAWCNRPSPRSLHRDQLAAPGAAISFGPILITARRTIMICSIWIIPARP